MRATRSSASAGLSRWRTGLLVPLVVAAAALSLPAFSGTEAEPAPEPDIAELVGASIERRRTDTRSERPTYLPEPGPSLSTASPPPAVVDPVLVSKTARWGALNLTFRLADTELPFRYHVGRALVERFTLDTVIAAMSAWDDIPGSRWATEFGDVVNHPGDGPRPDGHSVVYLRHDCPAGYLGTTRWNTHPERMHLDHRYGTGALYGTQVDIAVCDGVRTDGQLRGLVAHELGHAMGMAHLCEPGEVCWGADEHDAGDPRCRPMYSLWGPCLGGLTEQDHTAARHLYPTLARLHGPSRIETAARASYATTWTHTAGTVILTRADEGVAEAVLAAALSGALDSPLLLGVPDPSRCVSGPPAEELARAASGGATVILAGDWPAVCEQILTSWNLQVRHLTDGQLLPISPADGNAARLGAAAADLLAERSPEPLTGAFLAPLTDHDPPSAALDATVAAAEAGRRGVPLLFTGGGALSASTRTWLARHPEVGELWVVGPVGQGVLSELGRMGLTVVRTSGSEPVARAAYLAASHAPAPTRTDHPVVIGPVDSLSDAVVAASVAGRLNAPFLLSPAAADPTVRSWLERYPPSGGYVVGGPAWIPYPVQRAYSELVLPGNPVASQAQEPQGLFDLRRLLP